MEMKREELLKAEIKKKFKSVNAFAKEVEIPESSLRNIFTRGLGGLNVGFFLRICKTLDISADALADGRIEPRKVGAELTREALEVATAFDEADTRSREDALHALRDYIGEPSATGGAMAV